MNPKGILFFDYLPQVASPVHGAIWALIVFLGGVLAVIMLAIEVPG